MPKNTSGLNPLRTESWRAPRLYRRDCAFIHETPFPPPTGGELSTKPVAKARATLALIRAKRTAKGLLTNQKLRVRIFPDIGFLLLAKSGQKPAFDPQSGLPRLPPQSEMYPSLAPGEEPIFRLSSTLKETYDRACNRSVTKPCPHRIVNRLRTVERYGGRGGQGGSDWAITHGELSE